MDLPSEQEKMENGIFSVSSREKLRQTQMEDKTGRLVSIFKQGLSDTLFTTKCSRGIDFPGDTCKSVIFTKYPYPNIKNTFWKILKETHPNDFWEFYKDKSHREFLQRIYRAVRSPEDKVYILSPDIRVFQAVRRLQEQMIKN
jgi:Rad3-related DNA helicase